MTETTRAGRGSRVRRALTALLTLLVAFAGLVGVVVFFNARDSSTFSAPAGPGRQLEDAGHRHLSRGHGPVAYGTALPASGPHAVVPVRRDGRELDDDELLTALERGNVVLAYGSAEPPDALRRQQRATSGPFEPALAAAGQAVVLARRTGIDGVVALAWARILPVSSPRDPQLAAFVDAWLGRGAARAAR